MDGKVLLVIAVTAVAVSGGLALDCRVCASSQALCEGGDLGTLQTCSTLPGWVVNQCMKFDGEISVSDGVRSATKKGLMRSCYMLPDGVDSPPNRCLSNQDAASYAKHLISQVAPDTPFAEDPKITITINGDLCFCAEDGCNGVTSVQPLFWLILAFGCLHFLVN